MSEKSNGNPQESLVRNLIKPFRREGLLCLIVLTLFFYVLGVFVLYSTLRK
jgi:predicted MFS family arabinose efflux permease